MIEEIVKQFLEISLPTPVYAEIPPNSPKSFVVLEKTGGGTEGKLKTAMIVVQSYGETLHKAALLNESVKNAMEDLDCLDEISSCELNTDYNFTDTATKRYRYQAVFDIFYY